MENIIVKFVIPILQRYLSDEELWKLALLAARTVVERALPIQEDQDRLRGLLQELSDRISRMADEL